MGYQPEPGRDENLKGRGNEFEGLGGRESGPGSSAAQNRNEVFHKTQLCFKFMAGKCHFKFCRYAHGLEELRQTPINFQRIITGDELEIHRNRNAKRLRGDELGSRDSEAISIPTTSGSSEGVFQKPIYKKPCVCYQWQASGTCSFGDKCRFPHKPRKLEKGLEGLKNADSATSNWKQSVSNLRPRPVSKQGGSLPKPQIQNAFVAPIENLVEINGSPTQAQQGNKRSARWKWPQKISRIYGDWIDEE